MKTRDEALLWAGTIIVAAFFTNAIGLSDNASFGITAGLAGASWASIAGSKACGRSCFQ